MEISETHKIERVDPRNIGLFRLSHNKKTDKNEWVSTGRYWPTIEKAIYGVLQILSIDTITLVGSLQDTMREFKTATRTQQAIYEKILSQLHSVPTEDIEKLIKKEKSNEQG